MVEDATKVVPHKIIFWSQLNSLIIQQVTIPQTHPPPPPSQTSLNKYYILLCAP